MNIKSNYWKIFSIYINAYDKTSHDHFVFYWYYTVLMKIHQVDNRIQKVFGHIKSALWFAYPTM